MLADDNMDDEAAPFVVRGVARRVNISMKDLACPAAQIPSPDSSAGSRRCHLIQSAQLLLVAEGARARSYILRYFKLGVNLGLRRYRKQYYFAA